MSQASLRSLTGWWQKLPPIWQQILANQSFHNLSHPDLWSPSEEHTPSEGMTARQLRAIEQLSAITVRFHADTVGYDVTLDLAPLTFLPRLHTLCLNYVPLNTLEPLSHIKALQVLMLNGASTYDSFREHATLEPLRHLKQLETLVVTPRMGNLELSLEIIAGLHRLHYLCLCDTAVTRVCSLAPLSQLPQLIDLDISQCSITTLADIWSLPLKTLILPAHLPTAHIEAYRKHHPDCQLVVGSW
jgi:hypothetical protein